MSLFKWSKTAATNASADASINWSEGQAPSSVNDSARAMMAATAKWRDDIGGTLITAGTAAAYTIATTNQNFATFASPPPDGTAITFTVNATNNASATLSIDGGTAYPLQTSSGTSVPAGILVLNAVYTATFKTSVNGWFLNNVYNTPIPANTITLAMMQANSVDATKIVDGSVGNAELGTNAVTAVKILDGEVTRAKMLGDSGNKGKVVGYDYSTGNVVPLIMGGQLLHVREQQSSGVNSTSPITGSTYSQAILNTSVVNEITGASLASNQITLPSGTYFCSGYKVSGVSGSSNSAAWMRAKLFNVTGSANLILGSSGYSTANISNAAIVTSNVAGRFTLAGTSIVELRAWHVGGTAAQALSTGDAEVYSDILIWRIA